MKFTYVFFLGMLWGFFSCSRIETLNLVPHNYGNKGGKIIWIQFPGLEEEQLALLRFNLTSTDQKTSFEKSQCIGKAWSFNLFELRPTAFASYLSQITGSRNIQNKCEDIQNRQPVWGYLEALGYKTVIIENSGTSHDESLSSLSRCEEAYDNFLGQAILLKMDAQDSAETQADQFFHYQEKLNLVEGKRYFDKTCQTGKCFSSLSSNVKSIWAWLRTEKQNKMLVIRDYTYLHAIDKGDFGLAKESLAEMAGIYQSFLNELGNERDITIIVSSAAVKRFEFPEQGDAWAKFQENGKKILFRRNSLAAPVFASGPGSENFCGIYSEAELLKRILWRPKRRLGFF